MLSAVHRRDKLCVEFDVGNEDLTTSQIGVAVVYKVRCR